MSFIKQCKFLVWYFFIAFTCTMYTVTLPANIVIGIVTNSVSKHIHTVHTHCKNGVVMYKCWYTKVLDWSTLKIHVEYPDTGKQVHHWWQDLMYNAWSSKGK